MSTQAAMFLCPSKFSIGELHNALVAGRDLLAGGWRVQCMVSRRNLDYTKSSETDAELLSESGKDAEAVLHRVLADHHIWALEPTAASIRELLELGFPSLAADSLCLGPGARSLELAIAHHPGHLTGRGQYQQNAVRLDGTARRRRVRLAPSRCGSLRV